MIRLFVASLLSIFVSTSAFSATPELITISGYTGPAEDPVLSPDGSLLFFDSHVDQAGATVYEYWAKMITYKTFQFMGEINGINYPGYSTIGATLDVNQNFYFTSTALSGAGHGAYQGNGNVANAAPLASIAPLASQPGMMAYIMDARVSYSGAMICLSDVQFPLDANGHPYPPPKVGTIGITVNTNGIFTRVDTSAILANINALSSTKILYGCHITDDGLNLYFTGSDYPGTGTHIRIYKSTRSSESIPFGVPVEIVTPYTDVESPFPSPDGKYIYFHQVLSASNAQLYVMLKP